MTFATFLLFLAVPVVLLAFLERKRLNGTYVLFNVAIALFSVLYTTPWDNWLIENHVWWLDEMRLSGTKFGFVPIEELGFYMLIVLLGGQWANFVYHRFDFRFGATPENPAFRRNSALVVGAVWVLDVAFLLFGTRWLPKGTFLAQCLLITLPALAFQLAVAGDLFLHRRRFIAAVVFPVGMYLTVVAGLFTFGSELWVVDPKLSIWRIPHLLPVEMPFFYCFAATLMAFPAAFLLELDFKYFESRFGKLTSLFVSPASEKPSPRG